MQYICNSVVSFQSPCAAGLCALPGPYIFSVDWFEARTLPTHAQRIQFNAGRTLDTTSHEAGPIVSSTRNCNMVNAWYEEFLSVLHGMLIEYPCQRKNLEDHRNHTKLAFCYMGYSIKLPSKTDVRIHFILINIIAKPHENVLYILQQNLTGISCIFSHSSCVEWNSPSQQSPYRSQVLL